MDKQIQTIGVQIQEFQKKIKNLKNYIERIEEGGDNKSLRKLLTEERTSALDLNRSIHTNLKTMSKDIDKMSKAKLDKISRDFQQLVKQFEIVYQDSIEKEKALNKLIEETLKDTQFQEKKRPSILGQDAKGVDEKKRRQTLALQEMGYFDQEVLQQREKEIDTLATDMREVKEIFDELGVIVEEQGEMLDEAETHVDSAAINVELGNTEVEKAQVFQKRTSKKVCIIAIIAIVVAVVLVAVLLGIFLTK